MTDELDLDQWIEATALMTLLNDLWWGGAEWPIYVDGVRYTQDEFTQKLMNVIRGAAMQSIWDDFERGAAPGIDNSW